MRHVNTKKEVLDFLRKSMTPTAFADAEAALDRAEEEAYDEGWNDGYNDGHNDGYQAGAWENL